MERAKINERKKTCCREREEALNKISNKGISIIEGVSE